MIGHQPIIEARRAGFCWPFVYVDATPHPGDIGISTWWHRYEGFGPHVDIEVKDDPMLLDMRWIVGLTAIVHAEDRDRLDSVVAAIERHKAKRVIAYLHDPVTLKTIGVSDTQGDHTWPQS